MRKECLDCLNKNKDSGNSVDCYTCKLEGKTESEFYCHWEKKTNEK